MEWIKTRKPLKPRPQIFMTDGIPLFLSISTYYI